MARAGGTVTELANSTPAAPATELDTIVLKIGIEFAVTRDLEGLGLAGEGLTGLKQREQNLPIRRLQVGGSAGWIDVPAGVVAIGALENQLDSRIDRQCRWMLEAITRHDHGATAAAVIGNDGWLVGNRNPDSTAVPGRVDRRGAPREFMADPAAPREALCPLIQF